MLAGGEGYVEVVWDFFFYVPTWLTLGGEKSIKYGSVDWWEGSSRKVKQINLT